MDIRCLDVQLGKSDDQARTMSQNPKGKLCKVDTYSLDEQHVWSRKTAKDRNTDTQEHE